MTKSSANVKQFAKVAWFVAPAVIVVPISAYAQTAPRVTVDVSVNGTADSNPFLEQGGVSSLSGTLQVDPRVYWEDETTNVVLESSLRMSQYLRRYGSDIGGSVGVRANKQLNARTSLTAAAGFLSSRSTLRDFFLGSLGAPLDPVEFPEASFNDVTFAGRRTRVQTLNGSVGLNHVLGEDDSISVNALTSYSRFSGPDQFDYRTGSLGASYQRRLSERTTISAGVTGTIADYIGTKDGDARIIGPQFGIENKINERVSWTASLGASVATVDNPLGVSRTKRYLTGNLSICDRGVESALCGSVSRSAEPTSLGGIRAVTNLAVVFDKQLSAKDRVILSGRYGQTSQETSPTPLPGQGNTQLYGVSGTYSRDIGERLAFVVTPSFTKVVERRFRDEANYALTVGIRLRFGKLR